MVLSWLMPDFAGHLRLLVSRPVQAASGRVRCPIAAEWEL
jgi:hypothetical protein